MAGASEVSLRPVTAGDEAFLYRLYASTREAELAPLRLDHAARESLLRMQFAAQDRSYRAAHPNASFNVVVIDGAAAGRLYVERGPDAIHVIDIALLGEHRGLGVGTELLRALIEEAVGSGRRVTVNALRSSPVLSLYRRLGFEVVKQAEAYVDLAYVNTAS